MSHYINTTIHKLHQDISIVTQQTINNQVTFKIIKIARLSIQIIDDDSLSNMPSKTDEINQYQIVSVPLRLNETKLVLPVPSEGTSMKLFKINQNSSNIHIDLRTTDPNLILLNDDNWLRLNTRFFNKAYPYHSIEISAFDELTQATKSIRIKFELAEFQQKFDYNFKVKLSPQQLELDTGKVLLDLSRYFTSTYRFIVLNDTRSLDYDSRSGEIRLVRQLKSQRIIVGFKLFSNESDVQMGQMEIEIDQLEVSNTELVNLYISKRVVVGSTIYDLTQFYHATRILRMETDSPGSFELDTTGNKVLVGSAGLGKLTGVKYQLKLLLGNVQVEIWVHVLENALDTMRFGRLNYYFEANNKYSKIGDLDLKPASYMHLKFIHLKSTEISQIECTQPEVSSTNLTTFTIDNLRLFMDHSKASCSSYSLFITANFTADTAINFTRTIATRVHVTVNSRSNMITHKARALQTIYNSIVEVNDVFMPQKSIFSIDIYKLINWTLSQSGVTFKASLYKDTGTTDLEFNLNNRNGLLLIKSRSQFKYFMQRFKFVISIFDGQLLAGKFILNLYFHNKYSDLEHKCVFFERDYTYTSVKNGLKLNSLLFKPDLKNDIEFTLIENDDFIIRPDTSLQMLIKSEFSMTKEVIVRACHGTSLTCDTTRLFVNVEPTVRLSAKIFKSTSTSSTLTPIQVTTSRILTTETTLASVQSDRIEVSSSNIVIFVVLISLIVVTSSVTIAAMIYLRNTKQTPTKSASRKQLEMSISSDQNASHSGSMSSEGSAFCASQSIITELNSMQNRHSRVSVGNLQENYFHNEVFQSEFEMLRFTLNWEPSYGEFETVISDFEKFPFRVDGGGVQPCIGAVYHETDCAGGASNGQTFV